MLKPLDWKKFSAKNKEELVEHHAEMLYWHFHSAEFLRSASLSELIEEENLAIVYGRRELEGIAGRVRGSVKRESWRHILHLKRRRDKYLKSRKEMEVIFEIARRKLEEDESMETLQRELKEATKKYGEPEAKEKHVRNLLLKAERQRKDAAEELAKAKKNVSGVELHNVGGKQGRDE